MPHFECDCKKWKLPMGEWISKCPCGQVYQFVGKWDKFFKGIISSHVEKWIGNDWFVLRNSRWI